MELGDERVALRGFPCDFIILIFLAIKNSAMNFKITHIQFTNYTPFKPRTDPFYHLLSDKDLLRDLRRRYSLIAFDCYQHCSYKILFFPIIN